MGHLETLLLLCFFVLRLYFQDIVQKTVFYTFFSWFFVTSHLPNVEKAYVCNPKSALYWLHHDSEPYLTWILDLAIFRRQKYIFCIFYIFNALYHLRGTFKDTFTLGFFCFEAPFPRFGPKNGLVRIFQLIFFTGPLINVVGDYVWNPRSVGSRQQKLWAATFSPLEAAGSLNQPPGSFSYMFLG